MQRLGFESTFHMNKNRSMCRGILFYFIDLKCFHPFGDLFDMYIHMNYDFHIHEQNSRRGYQHEMLLDEIVQKSKET